MILILAPFGPRISLIYSTSEAFLTNEAATKSTFYLIPNSIRSVSSLSVRVGRSTIAPGKFMFFFSPILHEFLQSTTTWSYRIKIFDNTLSVNTYVMDLNDLAGKGTIGNEDGGTN